MKFKVVKRFKAKGIVREIGLIFSWDELLGLIPAEVINLYLKEKVLEEISDITISEISPEEVKSHQEEVNKKTKKLKSKK